MAVTSLLTACSSRVDALAASVEPKNRAETGEGAVVTPPTSKPDQKATSTTATSSPAPTTGPPPPSSAPLPASTAPPETIPGAGLGLETDYVGESGNPGYEVSQYDISLKVRPDLHSFAATAALTVNTNDSLSELRLDLAGLAVTNVTLGGQVVRWARQGLDLVIMPTEPIPAQRTTTVVVDYNGSPAAKDDPILGDLGWVDADGGAFVVSEPNGAPTWFPCNDHPSDKALYQFSVEVPTGVEVVANGSLRSTTVDGATTTWVWRTDRPMATYLATVALGQFVMVDQTPSSGPPLSHAFAEELSDQARAAVTRIPEMISFFADNFGPYPFDSYGTIVLSEPLGFALETQNRSIFGSDMFSDPSIQAHELAHQWFGDAVTPSSWSDIWLNEGFATYAEWLWDDHDGVQPIATAFAQATSHPALVEIGRPGFAAMFSPDVYERGGATLYALRAKVGDEAFFTILRTWMDTYKYQSASTAQFVEIASKVAGQDLNSFFNDWLYSTAVPK